VTLTGKDAEDLLEKIRSQNANTRHESLEHAKAEAEANGKEQFDLGKLEKLVDTSSEGRKDPEGERRVRFAAMYYLEYPNVKTLAEFAEHVKTRNSW